MIESATMRYDRLTRRLGACLLGGMLVFSCGDPVSVLDVEPRFAKPASTKSSGPVVSTVDPSFGRQAQTMLGVRISGSGFDQSATATWELDGAPAPGVSVLATRYVSSTVVEADIAIAADADIELYDVSVTLAGGKRGVGLEMFEVTAAQVIGVLCTSGTTNARGVNDAGQVVGHSCGTAFYWETGGSMLGLGTGIANGIDEAGMSIVGAAWSSATSVQSGPALVWMRSGSQWLRTELPSEGLTARANAVASDAAGLALVIAGNVTQQLTKRSSVIRPTLWVRDGAGWRRQALPVPSEISSSTSVRARGVNAAGQAAGGPDGMPVVWDPTIDGGYAATVLPGSGTAHGISPDGSVVVGIASGTAAYWRRTTAAWSGPWMLTSCSTTVQTWANAINARGVIGGVGCNGATAWVLGDAITEIRLGGLGQRDVSDEALGVSASRLVGSANGVAVYWEPMQ